LKVITLDTNVWLDLLLFHNRASLALAARLAASGCQAAVSSASLRELHRVLALKPLPGPQWQQAAAQLATTVEALQESTSAQLAGLALLHCNASATQRLPQCRDSTDQMFLELAAASNSAVLLTRDKALLKCRNYPLNDAVSSGQARGSVMTPAQLAASLILLI
jgi:putative PIN family toxin of toxin-antitoxin system